MGSGGEWGGDVRAERAAYLESRGVHGAGLHGERKRPLAWRALHARPAPHRDPGERFLIPRPSTWRGAVPAPAEPPSQPSSPAGSHSRQHASAMAAAGGSVFLCQPRLILSPPPSAPTQYTRRSPIGGRHRLPSSPAPPTAGRPHGHRRAPHDGGPRRPRRPPRGGPRGARRAAGGDRQRRTPPPPADTTRRRRRLPLENDTHGRHPWRSSRGKARRGLPPTCRHRKWV